MLFMSQGNLILTAKTSEVQSFRRLLLMIMKEGLLKLGGPFDQFIIALKMDLQSAVTRLEPIIVEKLTDFSSSHLKKLVDEYPNAGDLMSKLIVKFKNFHQ